jgi:predicted CXXCH cytochrome family protein
MKKTIVIPILLVLFPFCLLVSYGLAAPAAPAEQGCVTAKCHKGMLKTKNIHPAAEPCDTCHQSTMTSHPQKNTKTFKLVQEVPALCYQCHSKFGTMKHIHPPVKDGMCTTCHNPHDSAQPKLLQQPMKDLCTSCHPDKIGFKYAHGPASTGDCTFCHNPHQSNNEHLVVKTGTDLCFMCHGDMQSEIKKKYVHPALEMGCTSCHDPHGSSFKKFFAAEGAGLCYQCHPQIQNKIKSATSVHPPIKTERGCATCHNPHASDAPKLLPKAGKDLCLDCHKDLIKKTQTVLHGPIKDGKCTACHDPHATPNEKLLIKPYSTDYYVSYNDNEFQLCFTCHNRDLLRFPTTSYATGFRDGDRNLHYLHINRKDRGKRCKFCHVIHAGENPKLLVDKVPFGKWNLPLNFVKTETGGSCAPGCHQKVSYDRKTPGKEATPEKGKEKEKAKKK